MSFHDSLRQASLDGFDFEISTDDKTFGRDVKRHKIINADNILHEDVGVKGEIFSVEAVIGGNPNFVTDADEFEALLSLKGIRKLVLPHTQSMDVVVTDARRRHRSNEVGIVHFSITFEVSKDSTQTQSSLTTTSSLLTASNAGFAAGFADFADNYQSSVPDFVSDDTLAKVSVFTASFGSSLSRIGETFTAPIFTVSNALDFGGEVVAMFQDITSAFETVLNFSIAIPQTTSSDTPSAFSVVQALNKASDITITDEVVETSTASQSLRQSNAAATDLLLKVASISAAGEASVYADYESKEQALSIRDGLLESMSRIRTIAGDSGWNSSYNAMSDLMAAVNRDIDTKLGRLPDTITIDSVSVRSSLALAYRIYGDTPSRVVELSDDMITRNKIRNPVFVPAEALEVLIDA